ncbi:Hypothetical predicted protein [Xyrichtys novacula]|uniref:Uncharacterized protein n=1 Tax=Xyrichtys novacula TaxID=13765 RepID=A0AAV1HN79_XYRNO|nr:Hypothetical predicted protein [Xyrichtys novacula]
MIRSREVGVETTSSANYRPLISSAVTATLFLHVNDSRMGPHILPAARTMLLLKRLKPEKERKSEGCHSSSQLASPQWQRAWSLVREIANHSSDPPPPSLTSALAVFIIASA